MQNSDSEGLILHYEPELEDKTTRGAKYMRLYRETERGRLAIEKAQRKYEVSEKGRLARSRANAKYRAKQGLGGQANNEKRVASQILYRWCEMPEDKAKAYFDKLSATNSERWRCVLDLIRGRNRDAAAGTSRPLAHAFLREIV